jgi:hypothetical protein
LVNLKAVIQRPPLIVNTRPQAAGHDWPLYGDEYGRMKFGNMPFSDSH